MCHASDRVVGAVLGQLNEIVFYSIYYARMTLDATQINYTEKEMLALVYVFYKFKAYIMGTKVIVHNYHTVIT